MAKGLGRRGKPRGKVGGLVHVNATMSHVSKSEQGKDITTERTYSIQGIISKKDGEVTIVSAHPTPPLPKKTGNVSAAAPTARPQAQVPHHHKNCTCMGVGMRGQLKFRGFEVKVGDKIGDSKGQRELGLKEAEQVVRTVAQKNLLIMENARTQVLVGKRKTCNELLRTRKHIREQQLMLLQRVNNLNSSFVKNMEVVIRLGFCPILLQDRTDGIHAGLLELHTRIQHWDNQLESLESFPRPIEEQLSILPKFLDVFKDQFGFDLTKMSKADFQSAMSFGMDKIPDLLPMDEETLREYLFRAFDDPNMQEIRWEWRSFQSETERRILALEKEFINICTQFGVRSRLPLVSGCEWAYPNPTGHCVPPSWGQWGADE